MITIEYSDYPQEELVAIVARLAAEYTGYEHSSVTYERAQGFMEAVLYCINEKEHVGGGTLALRDASAEEMYESGRRIVTEKVGKLRELYNEMIIGFEDYGCVFLKETVARGIPAFLLRYDAKFAPQETLLTLDYPILKDLGASSGIDRVLDYVTCISAEQRFLAKFGSAYVTEVLGAYDDNYGELAENICEIVLQNLIGHMVSDKPLDSMGFDRAELENTEKMLQGKSDEALAREIAMLLQIFLERYYENEAALADYLKNDIPNIAARIRCCVQNHCLDRVFLI